MDRNSGIYSLNHSLNKVYWLFISVLLGAFLFFGGLGVELLYIKIYGFLVGILLVGLAWLMKGRLVFPGSTKGYVLFLVLFGLTLIWSRYRQVSFEQLLLFLSGGLFWVAFYNLSSELSRWLDKIVVILGLFFGGLFIANHFWGEVRISPWSLFLPYTSYLNHNNIGDLWAVVLTILVYWIIKGKQRLSWIFIPLGIYFLYMSSSRSAYIALAFGAVYLFTKERWIQKYKKVFIGLMILVSLLFISTGALKTTVLSRPYFVQAILGVIHYPFGVGVGNFRLISTDPANWIFGLSHASVAVHNVVLEVMAGMGVLGIVFAIWLFKVSVSLWSKADKKGLVYRASFFALLVNFLFHSTYFVPTMLWLWFAFLGISQASSTSGGKHQAHS